MPIGVGGVHPPPLTRHNGALVIRPKAIPAAAIRVTIFWILLFTYLYINYFDLKKTIISLVVMIFSVIFGLIITGKIIVMDRKSVEKNIESKTIRGMMCTIGEIPIHSPPLEKSADFPPKNVYPPEAKDVGLIDQWRARLDEPLKDLLDSVLQTLWAYKETPAAPLLHKVNGEWVSNGSHNHGGRSLVSHSLLVANLMCEQAKYYKYEVPKHNNIPLFKALDPEYSLDPNDPLIPIIGLSHDIGKIECMVWEDGKPNRMEDGHDYKGARIVARMDAFWNPGIDAESRRILQSILSHYHHVHELPMDKGGKPTSDRLHALMELLVKCDRVASAMENCKNPDRMEAVKQKAFSSMAEAGSMYLEEAPEADDLIQIIHTVLLGPERINVRDRNITSSIGWKYFLPQYNKTVILLKEDVFIKAVADLLGIEISPEARTGGANPVMHLTQNVLKALNVADLLFNDFESLDRSVVSQLYRADFYNPKDFFEDKEMTIPKDAQTLTGVVPVFRMESTIALQIDDYAILSRLKNMPNYTNVFNIGKARLGNQGVRSSAKNTVISAPVSVADLIANKNASKPVLEITPIRLKTMIERELKAPNSAVGFKSIQSKMEDVDTLILHEFDTWLLKNGNITFEALVDKDPEWLKLAGIMEVTTTPNGKKIIRVKAI